MHDQRLSHAIGQSRVDPIFDQFPFECVGEPRFLVKVKFKRAHLAIGPLLQSFKRRSVLLPLSLRTAHGCSWGAAAAANSFASAAPRSAASRALNHLSIITGALVVSYGGISQHKLEVIQNRLAVPVICAPA